MPSFRENTSKPCEARGLSLVFRRGFFHVIFFVFAIIIMMIFAAFNYLSPLASCSLLVLTEISILCSRV